MSRIYLATSWRNANHKDVMHSLQLAGHRVYNFKSNEPMASGGPNPTAFSWAEMDENWQDWGPEGYRTQLIRSQRAAAGYLGDLRGMEWADTCVLLLPCGRSAHIEAGYMKGRGKRLIIYIPYALTKDTGFEPDLMYLLADNIVMTKGELIDALVS